MNLYRDPARVLEEVEEGNQGCKQCAHDIKATGRRFKCRKGQYAHPDATRSTCIHWIPKPPVNQDALPNGPMQRRV